MGKSGCLLGFAGGAAIKTIFRVINLVLRFLANVLLFFGLYIPFIYLIFGLLLKITLGLDLFNFADTNAQLYLLGMLLCIVCSVIISARNLITKPIASLLAFADKRNEPEKPLIYRSRVMPELTVYEYKDRYDLFREINGRLVFYRTEIKRKRI